MFDKNLLSLPGVAGIMLRSALLILLKTIALVAQASFFAFTIVGLWQGNSFIEMSPYLFAALACFLLRALLSIGISKYVDQSAARISQSYYQKLLKAAYYAGEELVRGLGSAAYVELAVEGLERFKTYISLHSTKLPGLLISPLLILTYIFCLDWISGLIALVVFPFIILYMVILGKNARWEAARQQEKYDRLSNHFIDSVRGLSTLHYLGAVSRQRTEIYKAAETFRQASLKIIKIATLSSTMLDLFATGSLAAVAIMLGFRLVGSQMEFLPALIVLMLVPEYFLPVREFAADYHASLDGRLVLERLTQLDKETTRLLDGWAVESLEMRARGPLAHTAACKTKLSDEGAAVFARKVSSGMGKMPSSLQFLRLKNISHSFDGKKLFSHLSLECAMGEKVALIGKSGAGKSSLLKIIAGSLRPCEGSLIIEPDAYELGIQDMSDYKRELIYVAQQPYIFCASILENLRFYRPEASQEEVYAAAQACGLGQLIDELPDGLDTIIGQGGRRLSGGEAHRIAVCRALLDRQKSIALFDEPGSQLDLETELELKELIFEVFKDRLVIIATHRKHWIEDCDSCYELVDGGARRVK